MKKEQELFITMLVKIVISNKMSLKILQCSKHESGLMRPSMTFKVKINFILKIIMLA